MLWTHYFSIHFNKSTEGGQYVLVVFMDYSRNLICTFIKMIWMMKCLYFKLRRVPKNWCFWTMVLEKILESPLDCKEIKPVHPKWNQSWIFFGRTVAEAETPILWPPDAKNWLIGKDLDAGKDLREGEEVDDRGWDGWMALPTWLTWLWASSGTWWWTGKPGVLQFMGSQKVGHNWAIELNWIFLCLI